MFVLPLDRRCVDLPLRLYTAKHTYRRKCNKHEINRRASYWTDITHANKKICFCDWLSKKACACANRLYMLLFDYISTHCSINFGKNNKCEDFANIVLLSNEGTVLVWTIVVDFVIYYLFSSTALSEFKVKIWKYIYEDYIYGKIHNAYIYIYFKYFSVLRILEFLVRFRIKNEY